MGLRRVGFGLGVVLMMAGSALGQIFMLLKDPVDDPQVVRKVAALAAAGDTRGELEGLRKGMYQWKERDFERLFGVGVKLGEDVAMPVAEERGVAFPGLRYGDEKLNHDHEEVYRVGEVGYIEVYFDLDGFSPMEIVAYLRRDGDFVKAGLEEGVVKKRLAWDGEKLGEMETWVSERWREVYRYEVDVEKEKEIFAGDDARDPKVKVAAWKATGEKNGWRLAEMAEEGFGRRWTWYDGEGKVVREVSTDMDEKSPWTFEWNVSGMGQVARREERVWAKGTGVIQWYRADGTVIRCDSRERVGSAESVRTDTWAWFDGKGKLRRVEFDMNGDGVPDRVGTGWWGQKDRGLAVEKSWAVHPELVPEESRIGDEGWRVAVREIGKSGG